MSDALEQLDQLVAELSNEETSLKVKCLLKVRIQVLLVVVRRL